MRLLSEIEGSPEISQRNLARRVGVSVTLTNRLLHNLAQKGYVRITRASWRGWLYTLTPAGFSRKVQLTLSYIHRFLGHYQRIRRTLREEFEPLGLNPESRVAIYGPVLDNVDGTRELAELVYLALKELRIEEVDIFAPGTTQDASFLGLPVHSPNVLIPEDYDRVVVVSLKKAEADYAELPRGNMSTGKFVRLFDIRIV